MLVLVFSIAGYTQSAASTQGRTASREELQQAADAYRAGRLNRNSYDVNRRLAGLYLQANQVEKAIPFLQRAQTLRPKNYDNQYDLSQAYLLTGRPQEAWSIVQMLLAERPSGELHNLAGRIAEQQRRYIDAAHEFESAAKQDPSEDNIFVWGSELLAHRTYVAAIQIFRAGSEKFPQSARMIVGLGMSLYAHGDFAESVQSLLRATDLNPHDTRSYLYLSKAYLSSPDQADAVIERFRRYAELEPDNGLAQYYYAMSLWKGKRVESASPDYAKIETLLKRSIELNGKLAEAHLQLGILYSDQHVFDKAFPQYERAVQLAPGMPEAHFRMGRYYLQAGMREKAQTEFATFRQLQDEQHAAQDKAKAEVQQFVIANPADQPGRP